MKKQILLAAALLSLVINTNAGVKEIGTVNGIRIVRIKTAGLFAPSSTILVGYPVGQPGVLEVLSHASGPGVVPAIATAGGVVGGAALLRPAHTSVKNEGGNSNATSGSLSSSGATANVTTSAPVVCTPPSHHNNCNNN